MNIILGKENLATIDEGYVILELDTFRLPSSEKPVNAYCVLERVPLQEMLSLSQFEDLHNNLIKNYKQRNWQYCLDAVEHLRGKWNGEIDSFYDDITQRVTELKEQTLSPDWTGIIERK